MTTRKITFTLPNYIVRGAEGGIILGDFNNWNIDRGIPLHKNENGDLTVTIELISGESYQYRYLLSDGRWENDDSAHEYWADSSVSTENCVIHVSAATEDKDDVHDIPEKKVTAKKKKAAPKKEAPKKKILTLKNDLSKIEGINKQISSLLQQHGIETYKELGKSTIKSLKDILEDAGPKYNNCNPRTWPKQAKLAAANKWKELEELHKELKGSK